MVERRALGFEGAVDLHCHFGTERKRWSVNAMEVAQEAAAHAFSAVVLKSHTFPTAPLAWALNEMVSGCQIFGSVCCDHPVGGVNPDAVQVALRGGAKVVWMPTLSSQQDVESGLAAKMKRPLDRGLRIVGADRRLTEPAREVAELVSESGAVLATGHVSAEEHLALGREFGRRASVVVTHAMEPAAGPALDLNTCLELSELGCYIEFSMASCMTRPGLTVDDVAAAICKIGVDRCLISSDLGLNDGSPHPAPGLLAFADALVRAELPAADVDRLLRINPMALLAM